MEITGVDCFHVALPVKLGGEGRSNDSGWSIRNITGFDHFLLRIQTEDQLSGWGEAFAFKGAEALVAVVDKLLKLHEMDPDVIARVRSAIGPDIGLMVDTNCAWNEAEAIAAARSMQDLDLMMIEEPVFPPEDFAALARVQKAGGVPIAAGECACTEFEFQHMLEAGAVSFIQPSVSKVGGIGEFLKISDLSRQFSVPLMPHSPYLGPGFLATTHLLSALDPDENVIEEYLVR